MKHAPKKYATKRPVVRAAKKIRFWYIKSPALALAATLIGIFALGGVSYGMYSYVKPLQHDSETAASINRDAPKIDDTATNLSKATGADPLKKTPGTKNSNGTSKAPTSTTGAGCAGIACYTPGGFSIIASPATVAMRAGDSNVPITVRTKDGSKVDWGGMPDDGGVNGVGSYGQTAPGHSASFTYYLEAHQKASGTYHLSFYATKENPRQSAQATVTVKVTPVDFKPKFHLVLSQPPSNYGFGFYVQAVNDAAGQDMNGYSTPEVIPGPNGLPHCDNGIVILGSNTKWGWKCVLWSCATYGEWPVTFKVTATNSYGYSATRSVTGKVIYHQDLSGYNNTLNY